MGTVDCIWQIRVIRILFILGENILNTKIQDEFFKQVEEGYPKTVSNVKFDKIGKVSVSILPDNNHCANRISILITMPCGEAIKPKLIINQVIETFTEFFKKKN